MKIIDTPSPSQSDRPPGTKPRLVVMHGTVGTDTGDLNYLRKGGNPDNPVSYHYLLLRTGAIHRLVRPERRAWHAGASSWRGVPNVNDYAIGIGLSNLGNGEPYTAAQYDAAGWLLSIFAREYGIRLPEIVGHCHVSPGRKQDPWLYFEWGRLFAEREKYLGTTT